MGTGQRTAPRHDTGGRRWRPGIAWLVLGAVAVAGAGIAATAGPGGGAAAPPARPAAELKPITPRVQEVTLAAPVTGTVRLAPRHTERFSLIAVTWDDPLTVVAGAVEVRTRAVDTGRWSGWQPIGIDADVDARPGSRGGTAPLWVGPSDGAELRIDGRRSRLPSGMRLALIDPGRAGIERAAFAIDDPASPSTTAEADPSTTTTTSTTTVGPATTTEPTTAAPTTTTTTTTTRPPTTTKPTTTKPTTTTTTAPLPPAPASSVARPAITSRAGWGADESLREAGNPGYAAGIKAVFVHHTDTESAKPLTCEQSPELIRGIYGYHVKNRGWADIGYNFLVDACGTIFEGRHGGVDRPVIGAHTYGFNTGSTGIAVIGSYTDVQPPRAALAAVSRLAAWKLGQYKVNPAGSTTLVEGVADSSGFVLGRSYPFKTISGHRDGVATECPGDALYAQLGNVRAWAASIATPTVTGVGGLLSGGVRYTGSSIVVTWKDPTPSWLVSHYETLVDGKVAATSAFAARSVRAPIPAGRHTLQLRVRYADSSLAAAPAVAVFGDVTAPTFRAAPATRLRGGTVSGSAVPVTATWRAADNAVLARVQASAPGAATFAPAATAWATTIAPGAARRFTLRATDLAGNARTATWTATPVLLAESAGSRSGRWSTVRGSGYLGGSALATGTAKAALSWTVTGRGVAWVATRSATSGQARVYLDGRLQATIDLRTRATAHRQAVWAWAGSSAGRHTVKVVVLGTKGRPTVITDGLVVLR